MNSCVRFFKSHIFLNPEKHNGDASVETLFNQTAIPGRFECTNWACSEIVIFRYSLSGELCKRLGAVGRHNDVTRNVSRA